MQDHVSEEVTIINAENAILGRFASAIAKRLLNGEKIIIINADKGLISGDSNMIVSRYFNRYKIKTKTNPIKGPFYPRKSDQILKRAIRGMLPYRKSRGKEAYKRLTVYEDIPEVFHEREIIKIQESNRLNPKSSYISLGELSSKL
jgi:large subunit ribosomal protein L13